MLHFTSFAYYDNKLDLAGLRNKDRIYEFGTLTAETYVGFRRSILPLVKDSGLGVPIHVLLTRVGRMY